MEDLLQFYLVMVIELFIIALFIISLVIKEEEEEVVVPMDHLILFFISTFLFLVNIFA